MNSGFRTQCVPQYRLLTEEQIQEIHRASLEVLETVGVRLLDRGGRRDAEGRRLSGEGAATSS